jgi:transcriptional regulator with XRE-family HTH domain
MVQAASTRYSAGTSTTHHNWWQEPRPVQADAIPATPPDGGSERSLGTAIQTRRREIGMTQVDLALRVSELGAPMRQSDISRIEREKVLLPHASRLSRIAEALGLTLGDLLTRAGWDGAATEFTPEPTPARSDRPAPRPVMASSTASVAPDPDTLLERVREIRVRSAAILRSCADRRPEQVNATATRAGRR